MAEDDHFPEILKFGSVGNSGFELQKIPILPQTFNGLYILQWLGVRYTA
jgi:hypothetical protein